MRWLMLTLFIGGASYLSWSVWWRLTSRAAPADAALDQPLAPLPPPTPILGPDEVRRVRASLRDPDPMVRAAAVRLLEAVRDPSLVESLSKLVEDDVDSDVKKLALSVMHNGGAVAVSGLIKGLKDPEPSVRMASLSALAGIGDPAAAPYVAETAVGDAEPGVRAEAIRVLASFQEKRDREFRALAESLRKDYERAVRKRRS